MKALVAAMNGDGAPALRMIRSYDPRSMGYGDTARNAVSCLDTPPYDPHNTSEWPTAEDLADESVRVLQDVSPHFGLS